VPEDETDESSRAPIRLRIRQKRAVPVRERFGKWLEEQKPYVLPKSPINAAIGYIQNHWEALIRHASSGYLVIDNNVSEQHMKMIATGRKNWLFTGSEDGGEMMAIPFSMVSSCQRRGHDPFVYLCDVLDRLPDFPKQRLAEFLPDRWSPPSVADAAAIPAELDSLPDSAVVLGGDLCVPLMRCTTDRVPKATVISNRQGRGDLATASSQFTDLSAAG
jgi:hypothetical protein